MPSNEVFLLPETTLSLSNKYITIYPSKPDTARAFFAYIKEFHPIPHFLISCFLSQTCFLQRFFFDQNLCELFLFVLRVLSARYIHLFIQLNILTHCDTLFRHSISCSHKWTKMKASLFRFILIYHVE